MGLYASLHRGIEVVVLTKQDRPPKIVIAVRRFKLDAIQLHKDHPALLRARRNRLRRGA